jgi:ATP/maltotriose-dependent transcriptional regulator MalT/DNA-binding SARP family transcriptional activator
VELYSPRLTAEHLQRPSVNELLDRAAARRICLVIGAAGWGKSSAVAAWSRRRPTAWLRYEDHGGTAEHLLAALFQALQEHVPPPPTHHASGPVDPRNLGVSVAGICQWLKRCLNTDLVVVLDDVHGLAAGSDAASMVEMLCHRAPSRLHLILISRRELPFSLQRLRGRGLVAEIHAPDLAFDVADVDALLRMTVGADPPGLSRRVWECTDGWPAAVHYAVEMLRPLSEDQRLSTVMRLCSPGERFHGYLAEEVIGSAPECVAQLLYRLAIVGEVRSPAGRPRGLDDSTTALTELSRQGLVRRSGSDGASWVLVRPLRDYFDQEATPSPAERRALHVRAAQDCLGQHAPADALRHLLAAGDHAACAALLIEQGSAMVERGHLDAVLAAATLPAEYLDNPRIQQVLGQAAQLRGQWTRALRHFQRAGYGAGELEPALSWRVARLALAQGEFAQVMAVAERTRWGHEDTLDEVLVLVSAATAYRMTGELGRARQLAERAAAAAQRCAQPEASASVHQLLALLAAATADWRQADAHYTDALRIAETCQGLVDLTWIRLSRAFHLFEMGEPRQALADAQVTLSLGEQYQNPFFIAHALTIRGRSHARLGMLEAAAADFATAIDLFQRLGSRFLVWPLCALGDLHRTRGQLLRAQAEYEEALGLAEPNHEVFGLTAALNGLARVGAGADPTLAAQRADQAVALGEGLRVVAAILTRGWVKLMNGDHQGAAADAEQAVAAARQRRDNPGLAEAITLSALAANDPATSTAALREAIDIWQETGCRLEEAATRLVAANLGVPGAHLEACRAGQMLRDHGVDVESRRAAGPLGVLARRGPAVYIQTLGAFRVIREGVPVPNTAWKSKKARDLLKILIARRRATPRDQLMELLWPEVEPTVASNRLSVLLSTVRDVLQPSTASEDALVTTDGAVSLNPAQVRVDVEDFLARANSALAADRAKAPDASTLLEAAIAAYTGDFLQDDPYQEWALALAEEVRATHIALLRASVVRLREALDTDAVVRLTLRLLEQDGYDEQAHLHLVGALLDAGRLGEARRHYHTYARRMKEIGATPRPLASISARNRVDG